MKIKELKELIEDLPDDLDVLVKHNNHLISASEIKSGVTTIVDTDSDFRFEVFIIMPYVLKEESFKDYIFDEDEDEDYDDDDDDDEYFDNNGFPEINLN
jgi:hypothetical protein